MLNPRLLPLICACGPGLFVLSACKSERPTEFVNVAFTISVDADDYKTWSFDGAACEDFDVDWINHGALRSEMIESIEGVLSELGHTRVTGDEADFLVSYEFWIEPGTTRATTSANAKGSIVIRDGDTGRFVWRATKKATLVRGEGGRNRVNKVHVFVETMLQYVTKL